jgi:hypothetical protein
VNRAGGDASTDFELKRGLVASLGDVLQVTVVAASPHFARGVIRRRCLEVVRRATFTIAREGAATRAAHALGVDDIEIGDAGLDAALAINGWPADLVRAIVAQPSVRGELVGLFSQDGVRELRAGASTEEGVLRVAWQFAWDQLGALRPPFQRGEDRAVVGHQFSRIPRATSLDSALDRHVGHAVDRVEHFEHGKASTVAAVEGEALTRRGD